MEILIPAVILLIFVFGVISVVGALNRIAKSTEHSEALLETLVEASRTAPTSSARHDESR